MEEEVVKHVVLITFPASVRRIYIEGEEETALTLTRATVRVISPWARMAVDQLGLQGKIDVELPAGEAMEIYGRIKALAERLRRG